MTVKFNLDAAAIPDDESGSVASTEGSQPEQEVEKEEETQEEAATEAGNESEEESEEETVVNESRVPYSRFEKVNERAIRAEMEREQLRTELDAARRGEQSNQTYSDGSLPDYWVELYGDSDLSRKAYAAEERRMEAIEERASTRAVENLQRAEREAVEAQSEAAESIENSIEDFQAQSKRTFTKAQRDAILDIMDEFTAKDAQGNYAAPLLDVEKAAEIYDLRNTTASASKITARRKATTLASATSEGEPSGNDKETHFRAGSWDSWRNSPLLPKEGN